MIFGGLVLYFLSVGIVFLLIWLTSLIAMGMDESAEEYSYDVSDFPGYTFSVLLFWIIVGLMAIGAVVYQIIMGVV